MPADRRPPHRRRPLLALLFVVTPAWGVCTALLARYGGGLPAAGAALCLGGVVFLAGYRLLAGPRTSMRRPWSIRVVIGALEAANIVLYVAALHFAPIVVVIPLHLSSPIFLLLYDILSRRRRLSVRTALVGALVSAAIALLGLDGATSVSYAHAGIGIVLAVASGAAVAGLIAVITRYAADADPVTEAAWQLFAAGLVGAALSFTGLPSPAHLGYLFAAGLLLYGPAFALYWHALRSLDRTTAAIGGLNEALVAAVIGAVFFGAAIGPAAVAVGLLLAGAVALATTGDTDPRPTVTRDRSAG